MAHAPSVETPHNLHSIVALFARKGSTCREAEIFRVNAFAMQVPGSVATGCYIVRKAGIVL